MLHAPESKTTNRIITRLIFKCEDFLDDGMAIGPLYLQTRTTTYRLGSRYVTLHEAKDTSRHLGVELTES